MNISRTFFIMMTTWVAWAGFTPSALANWTLNIGYHNPVGSTLGLNFLYWGAQWNFELGLGWADVHGQVDDDSTQAKQEKDDSLAAAVSGDVNLKYRFFTGSVVPYIQAGIGAGASATVGDKSRAGAGAGGLFVGGGLMMGQPSFYGYTAYNLWSMQDGQFQAGIGFDI